MRHFSIGWLAILLCTIACHAQENTVSTQYTISFPVDDTKSFIDRTSFRGVTFDFRHHVTNTVAIGGMTGWYTFYQETAAETYTPEEGQSSITGKQFRYINSLPLLFSAHYYLAPKEYISPFGSLAAGVTYNRQDIWVGPYGNEIDHWQFTIAPEIGVRFAADADFWGYLSARYSRCFKTTELDTHSYISLNIGLMYQY